MNRPKYSIQTISKLTGVPVDTLRNWERRYHFLAPSRNTKGRRLYSELDVQLVTRFVRQVQKGERAGDVAERLRRGETLPDAEAAEKRLSLEIRHLIQEFFDALVALDLARSEFLHGNLQASLTFGQRLDYVYEPLFRYLGNAYETRKAGICQVQFVSAWIRQILSAMLAAPQPRPPGKPMRAVCATPPGEFHQGGLLMIASHLKYKGWTVYYLGAGTPLDEVGRFCELVDPEMVCLSISDPDLLRAEIPNVARLQKPTFVGGRGVQLVSDRDFGSEIHHFLPHSGESALQEIEKRIDLIGT